MTPHFVLVTVSSDSILFNQGEKKKQSHKKNIPKVNKRSEVCLSQLFIQVFLVTDIL